MVWLDIATNLIDLFEGCKLAAYPDVAGIWTVGYGSTGPDVCEGTVWTQAQAEEHRAVVLGSLQRALPRLTNRLCTDNQTAALVSFAYNVGLHALAGSTLLRLFNAHDDKGAADQFLRWDRAGGSEVQGLLRRRVVERAVFLGWDPAVAYQKVQAFINAEPSAPPATA
ncbi:MAG TPA: lysozyme [Terriglobia bacterium]|nr:lysozyme [Terriglobia bacterium]